MPKCQEYWVTFVRGEKKNTSKSHSLCRETNKASFMHRAKAFNMLQVIYILSDIDADASCTALTVYEVRTNATIGVGRCDKFDGGMQGTPVENPSTIPNPN